MIHILLHAVVPVVVAYAFWREHWLQASAILLAAWLVDLDHLLADPVYDPERCSIGFHPLHEWPLIGVYVVLFVGATWFRLRGARVARDSTGPSAGAALDGLPLAQLIGLGLLIHMGLDGVDCLR